MNRRTLFQALLAPPLAALVPLQAKPFTVNLWSDNTSLAELLEELGAICEASPTAREYVARRYHQASLWVDVTTGKCIGRTITVSIKPSALLRQVVATARLLGTVDGRRISD